MKKNEKRASRNETTILNKKECNIIFSICVVNILCLNMFRPVVFFYTTGLRSVIVSNILDTY